MTDRREAKKRARRGDARNVPQPAQALPLGSFCFRGNIRISGRTGATGLSSIPRSCIPGRGATLIISEEAE